MLEVPIPDEHAVRWERYVIQLHDVLEPTTLCVRVEHWMMRLVLDVQLAHSTSLTIMKYPGGGPSLGALIFLTHLHLPFSKKKITTIGCWYPHTPRHGTIQTHQSGNPPYSNVQGSPPSRHPHYFFVSLDNMHHSRPGTCTSHTTRLICCSVLVRSVGIDNWHPQLLRPIAATFHLRQISLGKPGSAALKGSSNRTSGVSSAKLFSSRDPSPRTLPACSAK